MKIRVYAVTQSPGTMINKVGKYLNKNIDGAFKIEFGPMECEVTMKMYYQIPGDPESFDEMHFKINITSYQNKIRVNLTEDTPLEKTIGQVILNEEELADLNLAKKKILTKLQKAIRREYMQYDFIF